MDTILDNAVQSIQIGIEDFLSEDHRRVLSAVRNITAGVLLLFKEKLRQMSPDESDEALLKQRFEPRVDDTGNVIFRGVGRKTADVQQIRERFASLRVAVDWKRFNDIVNIRNDIEHYCTTENTSRVKELLANSFLVMRDFITSQLDHEPVELLGDETWAVFLKVAEVYNKELAECTSEKTKIDWGHQVLKDVSEHLRCPKCQSELLKPVDPSEAHVPSLEFHCCACGKNTLFEDLVENACDKRFAAEMYLCMTDGGEPPLTTCHECARETYVIDGDFCAACGATREFHECAICGATLESGEQNFGGLCSYHHWQAQKDD